MSTKAMNIIEKSNYRHRRPIELDLANSEHAEYIAECYGGENHFKSSYPNLYAKFQNGITHAAQLKENGLKDDEPQGFQDAAYILDVAYLSDKKCLYAVGDLNLKETAAYMSLCMEIYKDGERVAQNTKYYQNKYYGAVDCYSNPFDIPQGEEQKYKAVLTAAWEPKGANYMRAMLAYNDTTSIVGTNVEVVDTLTVNDPIHKVSPEDGPITVSYARESDLDYSYPGKPAGGLQEVFLDMSGEVKLKSGHPYGRFIEFDAVLECDGYGTIFYEQSKPGQYIKESDDKTSFTWKMNNEWNNVIPESVGFGTRQHTFDMQIAFYCDGDNEEHRIVVSSKDYPDLEKLNSYKKISKIQLRWGCMAEDTDILMADGSTKTAKDIVKGDKIKDKDGNTDTVTNITTGTNQTIYHMKLAAGHELLVTDMHPICTDRGFVAVRNLNSETRVCVAGGESDYSDVLYCYPEEYSGKVYNFDLENGNTLITNGIVTGSGAEQGKLADAALCEENWEPDADIAAEIERMRVDGADGIFLGAHED